MYQTVLYYASREVNADQYEQHFMARLHNTGLNYPPETLRDAPLASYYFYWAEGDARGQWDDGVLQDLGVSLTPEGAEDNCGATAAEVLTALKARQPEVEFLLRAAYDVAIASLESAIVNHALNSAAA